eukprot:504560-Amphidinium_carterae.2
MGLLDVLCERTLRITSLFRRKSWHFGHTGLDGSCAFCPLKFTCMCNFVCPSGGDRQPVISQPAGAAGDHCREHQE